jgi:hypothetical protein
MFLSIIGLNQFLYRYIGLCRFYFYFLLNILFRQKKLQNDFRLNRQNYFYYYKRTAKTTKVVFEIESVGYSGV